MVAVAVGTSSLIIVLSFFNGIENLIRSLHNYFDPELKIELVKGKSFEVDQSFIQEIESVPGVEIVTKVIEDNAYIEYKGATMVVKIKGVDESFVNHHRLDDRIVLGDFALDKNPRYSTVIGRGVQYILSINNINDPYALKFFYPSRSSGASVDPRKSVIQERAKISGVFEIEKQYDMQYVFIPFDMAEELLQYDGKVTSLEIKVDNPADIDKIQAQVRNALGANFKVLNSDEQHSGLIKAIKTEKLFVYITLSSLLALASFNIFFSLTMLALDKKKDIAILNAMGIQKSMVKRIFLYEGLIISLVGACVGMFIGYVVCVLQQEFGIISMGMESSILQSYPVDMRLQDFIVISLSLIIVTLLASLRPASIAAKVDATEAYLTH